jgi:hypothetical protein
LYATFGRLLSVGFWAKPLINNAVLRRNATLAYLAQVLSH